MSRASSSGAQLIGATWISSTELDVRRWIPSSSATCCSASRYRICWMAVHPFVGMRC